jgi:hypothetical protein
MYVNEKYKGTTATASSLTKAKLLAWYSKITHSSSADIDRNEVFQMIYGTKYESLIDNYSYYWLSQAYDNNYVYIVDPNNKNTHGGTFSYGIRVLVSLPSDVTLSDEATGTKTLIDPRDSSKEYTYNVWDLK